MARTQQLRYFTEVYLHIDRSESTCKHLNTSLKEDSSVSTPIQTNVD